MADHSKPAVTDNYITGVLPAIKGRIDDVGKMFDSQDTAPTNQAVGSIRINRAIAGFQRWSGTAWSTIGGYIPSGTKMLFFQPAPPVGWTQITTSGNAALRLVAGNTGGSGGGNLGFTTAFSANRTPSATVSGTNQSATVSGSTDSQQVGGTVQGHAITVNEMPSHNHSFSDVVAESGGLQSGGANWTKSNIYGALSISNTGGGQEHSHGFTGASHAHNFNGGAHTHSWSGTVSLSAMPFDVMYRDVIAATKD